MELENILGETKEGMWVNDVVLPSEEESGEQDTESKFEDPKCTQNTLKTGCY